MSFFSLPSAKFRSLSFIILLLAMLFLTACAAQEKVYDIGIYTETYAVPARFDGLKDGLKALGYTEGKNIRFHELDATAMTPDQRQVALKDLTAKNYDAYWTINIDGAKNLKTLTKQPIIVVGDASLVGSGLAQSVERPGSNLTGVDRTLTGRSVKQLGWLVKLKPDMRAVYVLYDPNVPTQKALLATVRTEADRLGIKLVEKETSAQTPTKNLDQLKASEAQAVLLLEFSPLFVAINELRAVVIREKLLVPGVEVANFDAGAIFSYDVTQFAIGRQSATLLDKVLHGTDPATLPIAAPTKLELNLNQKLADEISFKFPEAVVAAADNVAK